MSTFGWEIGISEQSQFYNHQNLTVKTLININYSQDYSQHAMSESLHFLDGTHRLDDPVSNITLNCCGGVPMVIGP